MLDTLAQNPTLGWTGLIAGLILAPVCTWLIRNGRSRQADAAELQGYLILLIFSVGMIFAGTILLWRGALLRASGT